MCDQLDTIAAIATTFAFAIKKAKVAKNVLD